MGFHPPYWVSKSAPTHDFNREIVPPGYYSRYPHGVVGIRTDEDFWSVAALPYRYRTIPLKDIVAKFWPYIKMPVLLEDSKCWRTSKPWARYGESRTHIVEDSTPFTAEDRAKLVEEATLNRDQEIRTYRLNKERKGWKPCLT